MVLTIRTVFFAWLIGLPFLLAANPHRGFLITKNGKRITGYIGGISNQGKLSQVAFINDFGSVYVITAQQIKGFVYREKKDLVVYESLHDKGKWRFLRMIYAGEEARLFKAPPPGTQLNIYGKPTRTSLSGPAEESSTYYLQLPGRTTRRLIPFGFRRKMRKLLEPIAPELADRIGQPGYRFRDLEAIVEELDTFLRKTRQEV